MWGRHSTAVNRGENDAFPAFRNFFPKIKVKSVKNEKWPKMVKKGQKWIYLVSQHCLQPFLLPEPVKRQKKSFLVFHEISMIFGRKMTDSLASMGNWSPFVSC